MQLKGSIVILDFGGQYAHLIARRVRECGAFSAILPPETPVADLKDVAGIILSGGPQSVYDPGSPQADPAICELGVPVLGICYGHQWLGHALKGKVTSGKTKEYGHTPIEVLDQSGIFKDIPKSFVAWMSHGDEVSTLPEGFVATARSKTCGVAAMANDAKKIYGVQFHLEVVHTEHGSEILQSFVSLCDAKPWSVTSMRPRIEEELRKQVGDRPHSAKASRGKNVFMLVSGGVDSTVAFTLLSQVLGTERVQGLLVDTGLMRKGEVDGIRTAFNKLGIKNLAIEDASEQFFTALKGLTDPEAKRKAIGNTFLAVQKEVSERMNLRIEDGWLLGQGTIYPDTIETGGTKHADHIKTHHNRVSAVQELIAKGLVIEPLSDLYKDEVRILGEELGLPSELVWRHPFPGPGLGVRILCAAQAETVPSELPGIETLHVVLPVQSVGVQGDGRTYRHAIALFSNEPTSISEEALRLATDIPNSHPSINRVLQCSSSHVPLTFVATPMTLTRDRADLLREADSIAQEEMRSAGLDRAIWQFPVALLPIGTNAGGQSVVLRPVASQEAMTAHAFVLPTDVLTQMTERILRLPGIDAVFADLTNKPPATIEWE